MENGVKTNTYHWELSDDGKIFISTATELRPSGPVVVAHRVALRMSGSDDFAGQWRDVSYLQQHSELTLRLDKQYLHIGYPGVGDYLDAPVNGLYVAMQGPLASVEDTHAIRWAGRRELLILEKRNGKTLSQESMKLSDDGKVITESWWDTAWPTDKTTLIYDKQ